MDNEVEEKKREDYMYDPTWLRGRIVRACGKLHMQDRQIDGWDDIAERIIDLLDLLKEWQERKTKPARDMVEQAPRPKPMREWTKEALIAKAIELCITNVKTSTNKNVIITRIENVLAERQYDESSVIHEYSGNDPAGTELPDGEGREEVYEVK